MIKQDKSFLETCLEAYQQRSFLQAYYAAFELLRADTDALREKVFRLRYDVYCTENNFEKPLHEAGALECDAYDDRAEHYLLMHNATGEAAGTLRVILPNDVYPSESFPVQKLCGHPALRHDSKVLTLCEISRFCTAKKFRKRDQDGRLLSAYYDQDTVQGTENGKTVFFRRLIPYAPAALLQGAFETALSARIMEGVWMVDTNHLSSLKKIGFDFRTLGPHVKVHGGLQPVIFNIKNVLDSMRTKNPHCWDIVSDQGRLQKVADDLARNDWQDSLVDEDGWENYYERNLEIRSSPSAPHDRPVHR